MKPHLNRQWVIPPEQDARFVAKMEDVLAVYRRPYDPIYPVVCMDEMSRQLLGHVRGPTRAKPETPRRHDHHYQRNGTVNLFTFFEPLAAWRTVMTRERRTKIDWAECVRELLDRDYPDAEKVVLVMDNLNMHNLSSLYEAFEPAEARRLAERLEIQRLLCSNSVEEARGGCSLWKRFLRDEAQIAKPSDVFEHQRVTLALIAEALAQ